jgi:DIS3-like exonuclease 2
MLPRKLCEDYCSINPGEDKFAFSAIFHFDNRGQLQSEWFGQSVIRSSCRMAYDDAQRIIDGDKSGDSLNFTETELEKESRASLVAKVVRSTELLYELAGILRKQRFERGALSLNKAKLAFEFEDFNSKLAPKGFFLTQSREANWVVEEFMLLANVRVAEKIVEFMPECGLIRKHDPPQRKKLDSFVSAAQRHGVSVVAKSSKTFSESLERYRDDPRSDAIRLMATYCMSLAQYVCSGEDELSSFSHYALATPCYTHFTSPIRRYCDLVVHRQLLLALEIEKVVKRSATLHGNAEEEVDINSLRHHEYYLSSTEVEAIAENANIRKENARKCSDASVNTFFCLFIHALMQRAKVDTRIPSVCRTRATIVRIKQDRFSIYAPEIALDAEIFFNSKAQKWDSECTRDPENAGFVAHWGINPQKPNELEVLEMLDLFSEVVVELRPSKNTGYLKLDMLIEPPWNREGSQILHKIPAQL